MPQTLKISRLFQHSKCGGPHGPVGSNPTLSAIKERLLAVLFLLYFTGKSSRALRFDCTVCLQSDALKRLIKVFDDVFRLLKPDAEPDKAIPELFRVKVNAFIVTWLREDQAFVMSQ